MELNRKGKVGDLTIDEYIDLHSIAVKKYEYGIIGIAKIFGVSRSTAQKIKKSKIIDDAIYQNKNTIVIDVNKALELFSQKPK